MGLRNHVIVSERNIISAYEREGCEYAKRCVDYLSRNNLLPLYVRDNFPLVNVLASFAYYSGCVTGHDVRIYGEGETLERIGEDITRKIGFPASMTPKRGDRGAMLTVARHGSCASRLMEALGLPKHRGSKAMLKNLSIPSYRTEIMGMALNDELSETDVQNARNIERDSAAVLVSTRTSPDSRYPRTRWVMVFFSRPTKEEARALAEENIGMLNFAVPELEISAEDMTPRKNRSGTYSYQVAFNKRKLECITDGSRDLLKFSPRLQNLYGFELDFEPARIW